MRSSHLISFRRYVTLKTGDVQKPFCTSQDLAFSIAQLYFDPRGACVHYKKRRENTARIVQIYSLRTEWKMDWIGAVWGQYLLHLGVKFNILPSIMQMP